jgi:hypothetical protein
MKCSFIFETLIIFVIFCLFPVSVSAQPELSETILWNHEVKPSFHKTDKTVTYPDFLPRFPSVAECERYGVQVNEKYLDDSLKILSLFVAPQHIPKDIKKHLIAVRDFKDNSIITIPDLMQRKSISVREAFMVCWSTENWSWFYIDTLTSVVLFVQMNPDYRWGSDNEYSAVALNLQPNFLEMIQNGAIIEEELFQRRPIVVASLRRRGISINELEKKSPWGLAPEATFFRDSVNEPAVFCCDKLIDKKIVTNRVSRFSSEAGQEHLLAVERELVLPQNHAAAAPSPAPPPAKGTEEEILAQLAKYHRERDAAEARTRELMKMESERLKVIASYVNLSEEERKKIMAILWREVYVNNWQNKIDQSPAEFSALQKLLTNDDADCRDFAIRMLYSTNPKVIQKVYLEAFPNEKNIKNKTCLIESLGWKGDEECIPFLETIYSDKKNPPIIRHVAWKSQNILEAKYKNKMLDTVLSPNTDSNKQKNNGNKK